MFPEEPPQKRQRASQSQHIPGPPPVPEATISGPSPGEWHARHPLSPADYNSHNYSSPHSGATFDSPSNGWYHDGFAQDPGFLASQEELRGILFSLAYSAAPTRAATPAGGRLDDKPTDQVEPSVFSLPAQQWESLRPPLSSTRRVEYLKNYITQVAPWVGVLYVVDFSGLRRRLIVYASSICLTHNAAFSSNFPH
jgi:hypothetical protein